MSSERIVTLFSLLAIPLVFVWLQPFALAQGPGHGGMAVVSGEMSDKIIKAFDAAGLTGVSSIEYRRLTMSPGARLEGKGHPTSHVELCIVEKGSVTYSLLDGSRRTYSEGDVFIVPKGAVESSIAADSKAGFVELYWNIHLKGGH